MDGGTPLTGRPADTGKSMLSKEILAHPNPSVTYCHGPSIVQAPSGHLLVARYAYPNEETRNGRLALARRRAGAKRFERPRRIGQTHFFGSDPVSKSHETTEFPKTIQMLRRAADTLSESDVRTYNCSPDTNLDC